MSDPHSILQPVLDHPAYQCARQAIAEGTGVRSLAGLTPTAKALVIAALAHDLGRPLVVVTRDNEAADSLRETSETFLMWLEGPEARKVVASLPEFDCSPHESRSPHAEILERRAATLWNIGRGRTRVLVCSLPAALGRFREASFYRSLALEVKPGDQLELKDLVEHLEQTGYETAEPVENLGQFSVRGGIVDVFPPQANSPLRLEFFGDQIESLREFEAETQRSRRPVPTVLLLPLAEVTRSNKIFDRILQTLIERSTENAPSHGEPPWASGYGSAFPGWEFYVPLVEPHPHNLLSLLTRPVLVWDEPAERKQQLKRTLEDWNTEFDAVSDAVPARPRPAELFLTEEEFLASARQVSQLGLQELAMQGTSDPAPAVEIEGATRTGDVALLSQPAPKFRGSVKSMVEEVRKWLERRWQVVFVIATSGKSDRLREILAEYDVPFATLPSIPGNVPPETGAVLLARGEVREGVIFPELSLVFLSDNDLFGAFAWSAPVRRERLAASSFISDLRDLKVGDYVVHLDHGIGLYQGLRQLSVEGVSRDFMLLTYQDDAKLYVPLERLDLVEKFRRSGDGAKPALDRLGGATWARTKSRVKHALRDMAQELLQVYAQRKTSGGVPFSSDTPWQKEFEDAFEFEETPDQLTALEELKRDLESPQPMDRLLCGDVGYGKTELAMRAAFKVAQDGKQVAILAPTTVLAFQHYTTFSQRMSAFPLRVEMLSRFRSAAEQKKVIADTEAGRVDILIGTHRLLSSDVRFHDLGLLIVDEEQRFGVAAKEKLKKLKAGIDVLTMSATPIPRTLHMSIGGLRDLSIIETPPRGRLAIQTVVAPFSDGLLQSAVLHEMERNGQVYFVHNRVESIFSIAALLQRLVPTARIGVAHGQMGERELEKVMLKFIRGEYDVLASTALIENGLDIPRANTILVNHADRFGMADLYQLRGRVGRSDRRAYAYFLVPAEEALSPTARRRLAAIKEFSELGAGFRLAALDLELRGAGNLLGAEQSGHLNAVGLDLYLQMLEETVRELKGGSPKPEVRTSLNLGLDIKIPDTYIADESQRLRMYKRISALATGEDHRQLEAELADRYGPIPPSVKNLLSYALLKSAAVSVLVQSIERKAERIWVRFSPEAPVNLERLKRFIAGHRGASIRPDGTLQFLLPVPDAELPGQIANALRGLASAH